MDETINQTTTPEISEQRPPSSELSKSNPAKKLKVIFIVFFIIFFLTVSSAAAVFIYKLSIKQAPTKILNPTPTPIITQTTSPTTIQPTLIQGLFEGNGYQLMLPEEYFVKEDPLNGFVQFGKTVDNSSGKYFIIQREQTKEKDPCALKLEPRAYPNSKCTIINGYRTLDWGTDIPPYAMGPLTNTYSLINNGIMYKIVFLRFDDKKQKDQILSTFKFTEQNQAMGQSNLVQKSQSPDGMYLVKYEVGPGDFQKISIADSTGKDIASNVIQQNWAELLQKMHISGGQMGWEITGWKNSSVFTLKILVADGSKYEVDVNAKTGQVENSTFKSIN